MTQPERSDFPDDDELRRQAGLAAASFLEVTDHEGVMKTQNEAGEAMAMYARELLRAGIPPEGVAGALGGVGATVALLVCAEWANGGLE